MKLHLFVSLLTLSLFLLSNPCNGARILSIYPTPSISHQIVYRRITEELARRGHHLTVVTTNPVDYIDQPEMENITQINVKEMSYQLWNTFFSLIASKVSDVTSKTFLIGYYDLMMRITDKQLSHPEVKRLIQDPNGQFDLLIAESNAPTIYAFKDRFHTPLIQINSIGWTPHNSINFGTPTHIFMDVNNFAPYDPRNLTILQKLDLLYSDLAYKFFCYVIYTPLYTKLSRKHFGPDTRPANILENESDLILTNLNPLLHGIVPMLPAMVDIGSIHIVPPDPLPQDLQSLLDNSTKGVIYFNLGSNIKSNQLPDVKRKVLLDAFAEMPYTVIWKWEDDDLPGKTSNVHVSKWLPQQGILAHPNVKLFVTQGGKQSVEETIHYGVPIIGIPFIIDQFANCFRMQQRGGGISMELDKITTENFKATAMEIIKNSRYKKDILKLRELMYDTPQTPLERAIWWIEYVIRHNGTKHLRSPGADASYFEYFMVDMFILFAIFFAVVAYFIKFIFYLYTKYSIVVRTESTAKKVS